MNRICLSALLCAYGLNAQGQIHKYSEMRAFKEATFPSTVITEQHDTLAGNFRLDDDRVIISNEKHHRKSVPYSRVEKLMLTNNDGTVITLEQMPGRDHLYRLVASKSGLGLYDDEVTGRRIPRRAYDLYFYDGKFCRQFTSDFNRHKVRTRVLAKINNVLNSHLPADADPDAVITLFR